MSESSRAHLERAYEMIEQDDYDGALRILRAVVDSEPTNADAWWLMANAVEDPKDARLALINVLKNDPTHSRARETLDTLNDQIPPSDDELKLLIELDDTTRDVDLTEMEEPMSEEELFDLFDESSEFDVSAFEADEPEQPDIREDDPFSDLLGEDAEQAEKQNVRKGRRARQERKRNIILRPVLVVLVAALAATALFLLTNTDDSSEDGDPGQPDFVALAALDEADTEADLVQLAGRVRTDAARIIGTETSTFVVDDGTQTALYVQSCICISTECQGPPAAELPRIVRESFLVVAERVEAEGADIVSQAGVNITACTADDTIYRATVDITDAINFLESDDLEAFRASWNVTES